MANGRPTVILQSIARVIRENLRLRQDQVILARQKFDIAPTGDLLVVVSLEDSKPIGNNFRTSNVPVPGFGVKDESYMTVRDSLQIDVLAMTVTADGSNQARDKRNQVLIALASSLCEQEQQKYGYSIARVPTGFVNTSSIEETEYLERYTATLGVTYGENAEQFPDYYEDFSEAEVTVNQ